MVVEVKPVAEDVDSKAMRVFLKSIEILGGPKKLVEHRNLTWLPSLMAASYAIVYAKEKGYSAETIASLLGMTKQSVQNMLRADPEVLKAKLGEEIVAEKDEERRTHTAGALAKLAYQEIMAGRDEINLAIEITKQAVKSLGAEWAVHVLSRLKGADFPVEKDTLKNRLGGLVIKGRPIEEILDKLEYPIKSPAELLHQIRKAIENDTNE